MDANLTNQPPLVSVIIPTFNRERDIQAAVFSSLKQTHHNIEVIVVDDASNDETAKKVENITDPRVRLVHHLENKGVSSARNTGIDKASGAYIAFLDSDDHWLPEKLETQLHILNCMPSAQAVTCSYVYAHRNGAKEVKTTSPSCRDIIEHGPHVANVGSCLLIRKQALSNVGEFNCSMNYNEDYEWLLRFISAFPSGMAGVVPLLLSVQGQESIHHRSGSRPSDNYECLRHKYAHNLAFALTVPLWPAKILRQP